MLCRDYAHCDWWGNWASVNSSTFVNISKAATEVAEMRHELIIVWHPFQVFTTLHSCSICYIHKRAWTLGCNHLLCFIRCLHRLKLGSPKTLRSVKIGGFFTLTTYGKGIYTHTRIHVYTYIYTHILYICIYNPSVYVTWSTLVCKYLLNYSAFKKNSYWETIIHQMLGIIEMNK